MKKTIFVYIFILPLILFGQKDSIFGTYLYSIYSRAGEITLYSNNTFKYVSGVDIGYVPVTHGKIKFSGDTVFFSYSQQIDPEIIDSSSQFNPDHQKIIIKISGISHSYNNVKLYINRPYRKNGKIIPFDSSYIATIDSIKKSDQLFIHVGNYSWVPIFLNFPEKNEYYYKIQLPRVESIYYLTEKKALLKKGFMYFSMSEDGIAYYNTDVYKRRRDTKKIFEVNWQKYVDSAKSDR